MYILFKVRGIQVKCWLYTYTFENSSHFSSGAGEFQDVMNSSLRLCGCRGWYCGSRTVAIKLELYILAVRRPETTGLARPVRTKCYDLYRVGLRVIRGRGIIGTMKDVGLMWL